MPLKMYPNPPISSKGELSSQSPLFMRRGNRLFFVSLGCPRNRVDTEVMLGILLKSGYEPTDQLEEGDFLIINTCGFLQEARNESLATIGEIFKNKKEGAKVIVTGCMVQTHAQHIRVQFPQIDYLLGSGDVGSILKAIEATDPGSEITTARSYLEAGEVPRKISTPSHYAYLKIAEGCRKQCSYCIIPQIKGPLKSKPIEQIVKEFRILRAEGVQEVILIAQDLGDWGRDQGYKRGEELVHVLETLLLEKGDFWIRLLYLYPDEITPRLVGLMQKDSRICPYLDMPIQHVNDPLLKAMHRTVSKKEIIRSIDWLRSDIPHIAIRTSLIVGFPGETESQFEELLTFIQEHPLDHVGIFTYSKEEGSYAARLSGHLPQSVKKRRQKRLASAQKKVTRRLLKQKIGRTLDVVIEGYHPDSSLLMVGRTQWQCPEIDGVVIINDCAGVTAFGKRYPVTITDSLDYDLIGSVAKRK